MRQSKLVFLGLLLTLIMLFSPGGCKKESDVFATMPGNKPPVISAIPDQAGGVLSLDLSPYVTDKADDVVDLTFTALNGGSFTGAVYGNIFTGVGTHTVNFSVVDTGGLMALGSFNVVVNERGFSIVPGTRPGVDYPIPRIDHAMAFDSVRGVVVLFGGQDFNGNYYSDTWEWDGTAWADLSPTGVEGTDYPSARINPAMAFDGTNVVLFGGSAGGAETWQWNGTTWTDVSPAGVAGTDFPTNRSNHAMAYNGTNVVLFGGGGGNDTWHWDGAAWPDVSPGGVAGTDFPTGRSNHAMAFDGANVVLFGGGANEDTWEWDGAAWTDVSPGGVAGTDYPTGRNQHVMAYDGTNVVLFGGNTDPDFSETWTWDGGNWSDSSPAGTEGIDNPYGCEGAAMAYDSTRGVVVMFGGDHWFGDSSYEANTWEWDGTAQTWTNESPQGAEGVTIPSARRFHSMAFDAGRNVVVMFGGSKGQDPEYYLDDTWEWDGTTWANVSPTTGTAGTDWPSARRGSYMVYDPDRAVVVLFGGEFDYNSIYYNDVWEWDGTTWTDVSPTSGTAGVDFPEERRFHAMAYDTARDVIVMFGGANDDGGLMFDDTWEWDGTAGAWTEVTPVGTPGTDYPIKRRIHDMVYDSARGVCVMFGGEDYSSNIYFEDTWTWDGSEWINVSPPGVSGLHFPEMRRHHKMAYDSNRGVTVLFGGEWDQATIVYGDTWEYDGSIWQQISMKGGVEGTDFPLARRGHAMVFDSNRGVMVLFGGNQFYGVSQWCLNDIWEF